MRFFERDSFSNFMIMRALRADLRAVALCLAVCIYAIFGSPTPDDFSGVTLMVGGLLLFAIGGTGLVSVLRVCRGRAMWFCAGQVFLLYGIIVGVVGGIIGGHDMGAMLRDILPFGFMFLPLFLMRFENAGNVALLVFALMGVIFAVRASAYGVSFGGGGDALYYLGNSPSVLFAALFFFGLAMLVLSQGLSAASFGKAGVLFTLFVIAMVPIIITAQRASMAALCVYVVLAFVFLFVSMPRRMTVIGGGGMVLALLLFGGFIQEAFDVAVTKSALVGANMRVEEWGAVWREITVDPFSMLFGKGWGASFSSPAVADIDVYFTHSLLSSMLLKIGVLGFLACGFYVACLFVALLGEVKRQPLIVMAVAAPFLIDVFLYAAFKSLDFGLLLALIPVVVFSGGLARESIAS